jgi:nucleoside-diphosphate-sugar epimerase
MSSSGMRVAVTGGAGRIGSSVIKELVSRGHTVVCLDRRAPHEPTPGVRFVFVDLRQREQVQPILENVDAVCHLGEIPNPYDSISPEEVFYTNTRIGSTVLQTAADLKLKHVVYTSSAQVYGVWGAAPVPPLTLPMDETHPVQPQNQYSLSKVANEMYAAFVARVFGLSVSIFRLPLTWSHVSERYLAHLERGYEAFGEMGTYLYASDAAVAYAQAVERALPGCEVYHLTADDVATPLPLAEGLNHVHPDWPTLPPDWPAYKSPVLTTKAREKLGWSPKCSIRDEFRKKFAREPLMKL